MKSVKNFFDSFKEFVWDIIGFIIPGSYLLMLLSICINETLFVQIKIGATNSNELFFILGAYLLGYLVYGFSFLKEKSLGKYSYMKKVENSIANNNSIKWAKEILKVKYNNNNISEDFSSTSVRELRNIVMSFIPEVDQKIYTFTFRSDVSNNTANISLVIGSFGLLFSLIGIFFDGLLFNTGFPYTVFYICLIGAYFPLKETRDRFYSISVSIPFSIFNAKNLNNEPKTKGISIWWI